MKIDWNKTRVRIGVTGRSRHRAGVTNDGWIGVYHDHALWLMWTGEGRLKMQHGWESLHPGVCLWVPPGRGIYRLMYNPNNPIGNYFIHFDLLDAKGEKRSDHLPLPPSLLHPPDGAALAASVHRIVNMVLQAQHADIMAEAPQKGSERDAATALLTGLLMDLDAQSDGDYGPADALSTHHRDAMTAAIMRLTETMAQQPDIAEIAKEQGYSPDHFTRVFKRIVGQPPKTFAVEARMRYAADLLRNTDKLVKEIADQTGYESVYSFSAQFKRSTGMTPTEFRLSAKPAIRNRGRP